MVESCEKQNKTTTQTSTVAFSWSQVCYRFISTVIAPRGEIPSQG
ncbi:hypothetical protein CDAR_240001, partial [Caerostris darwini]